MTPLGASMSTYILHPYCSKAGHLCPDREFIRKRNIDYQIGTFPSKFGRLDSLYCCRGTGSLLTLLAVSVLAVPPQHGGEQQQQSQTCPHGALLALCCLVLRSNRIEQFQHKSGLLSSSVFSHCNGQSSWNLQTALRAFLFHHISIFILLIRCPLEYCDNHVCSILQLSEEARTRHITRPYIW